MEIEDLLLQPLLISSSCFCFFRYFRFHSASCGGIRKGDGNSSAFPSQVLRRVGRTGEAQVACNRVPRLRAWFRDNDGSSNTRSQIKLPLDTKEKEKETKDCNL